MKYISVYADKLKRGRMDLIYPLSSDSPTPTADGEFYFTIAEEDLTLTVGLAQSAAYALTVDWGDGSTNDNPSDLTVNLSHSYAASGNYVVSVTCAQGETWTFSLLPAYAFTDGNLTKAIIRSRITAFSGGYTFYNLTGLTGVIILSNMSKINAHTFDGCTGLMNVTLPSTLTTIERYAFLSCQSLTNVTLPSLVSDIGASAFSGCTSLMSITSKNIEPPTTRSSAFDTVPAECAIYVPAESVSAYQAADTWSTRAAYIQAIPT